MAYRTTSHGSCATGLAGTGWIDSVDSKIRCPADGTTTLPMRTWTQGKSTPRALTRTNEGGHGCERGCRCEGSRPPGIDILDRGAALPHAHNRRVLAVGTAPALAKGTSSIEPAGRAEKAAATKLEALEPTATGHIHEAPSPRGGRMGKPDAPSPQGASA